MVALGVAQNLVHVPDVLALLVGLVHVEVSGRARVGVEQHLFVRFVVRVEHVLPLELAERPVGVERAERLGVVLGHEAHAAEQGVAHKHRECATVAHDHVVEHECAGLLGHGAGVRPLVHQARIDGTHDEAQPGDDVFELVIALVERQGPVQAAVGLGEIAQQDALGAGKVIRLDVALEVRAALEHVAQHRLGGELVVACPRHRLAVLGEGFGEHVFERLGVGHVLQALDALVVFDAVGLHLGHGVAAGLALLGTQHLAGLLERGLDHRDNVEGVRLAFRVEQLERRKQEGGKRLVKGEVVGQVHRGEVLDGTVVVGDLLHHACVDEGGEHLVGAGAELELLGVGLHGVVDELVHARPGVAALLNLGEHHGVGDAHARRERGGHRLDELVEVLLVPANKALGRLLRLDAASLLGVAACLGEGLRALDVVLGGLGDDQAFRVEACASCAAGNLVELARAEPAHVRAVELGKGREQHGVDGHVDAYAERVGSADDRKKALLSELLHKQAIAGEHACVVHAHAAAQQALEYLAEGRGEARALDGFLDALALLLGGDAEACQ